MTPEERRKVLEDSEKKKKKKGNEVTDYDEEDLELGDMFDVVKEVVKVNSPISTMNPDFIWIDLSPSMLENPLIEYVKSQLQVVEAINIYLSNTELKDEEWRVKINQILLNKVYSTVILSRGHDGKVIKAILDYIRRQAGQTEGQSLQPIEESGEQEPKRRLFGLLPAKKPVQ